MADGFRWVLPGDWSWSGTWGPKKAAVEELLLSLMRQLVGYRSEAGSVITTDDRVVVQTRGHTATTRGESCHQTYRYLFRVADGHLTEVVEYRDTALVERSSTVPSVPGAVSEKPGPRAGTRAAAAGRLLLPVPGGRTRRPHRPVWVRVLRRTAAGGTRLGAPTRRGTPMKRFLAPAVDNIPSRIYLVAAGLLLGWAACTHLGPGFPEGSMPEIALAVYLLPGSMASMGAFSLVPTSLPVEVDSAVLWFLFILGALLNALLIGGVVRLVRWLPHRRTAQSRGRGAGGPAPRRT